MLLLIGVKKSLLQKQLLFNASLIYFDCFCLTQWKSMQICCHIFMSLNCVDGLI